MKSLGLLHPKLRRAHSLSRYADDPDQLLLKLISAADDETRQGYGSIFIKKLLESKSLGLQFSFPLDSSLDFQTKLFGLDLSHILPDLYLQKTDRATASHGLECRVPFLDDAIVSFSKTNRCYDVSALSRARKADFKKVVEKKLPSSLIKRAKRGFGVPFNHWLQTKVCQKHANEAFDKIDGNEIFISSAAALFDKPCPSKASLAWKIYMLLLFLKAAKMDGVGTVAIE